VRKRKRHEHDQHEQRQIQMAQDQFLRQRRVGSIAMMTATRRASAARRWASGYAPGFPSIARGFLLGRSSSNLPEGSRGAAR